MRKFILVLVAAIGSLTASQPASSERSRQAFQMVDVSVLSPPTFLATIEGWRLALEVHVTNFSNAPLTLASLTIAERGGDEVTRLDGGQLRNAVLPIGPDDEPLSIEPGSRAVVYIDAFPERALGSKAVLRISARLRLDDGTIQTVQGISAALALDPPARLSAPLRGGPWVALYQPDMERGHRRVFYATDGRATLPGRFAIDFMKIDEQGRTSPGDGDDPSSHYGYGAEVLAVADGVVVDMRDDVPDPSSRTGRTRPVIGDASGNFVALDIGRGRIVFYEHLQHGAAVALGDRVRRGEVIGRLGFTGSASSPHLHLHVADSPSVLGAEGRPFLFKRFVVLGRFGSIAEFEEGGPWRADDAIAYEDRFPAPNVVLRFEQP